MRVMHSWELESDMRAKYPKLFLFELVSLNFGDEISFKEGRVYYPGNLILVSNIIWEFSS